MMPDAIKPYVGMPYWFYNDDYVEYKDGKASKRGGYEPGIIISETSRSWCIGRFGQHKIPKVKPWPKHLIASKEDIDKDMWVRGNSYKIGGRVDRVKNYTALKAIEAILDGIKDD